MTGKRTINCFSTRPKEQQNQMRNTIFMKYDDKMSYFPKFINFWNLNISYVIHSFCKVSFPPSSTCAYQMMQILQFYLNKSLAHPVLVCAFRWKLSSLGHLWKFWMRPSTKKPRKNFPNFWKVGNIKKSLASLQKPKQIRILFYYWIIFSIRCIFFPQPLTLLPTRASRFSHIVRQKTIRRKILNILIIFKTQVNCNPNFGKTQICRAKFVTL